MQTKSIPSKSHICNTKQFTQTKSIPSEPYICNTKQFTQSESIPSESHIYNKNNLRNQNRFHGNHIFITQNN